MVGILLAAGWHILKPLLLPLRREALSFRPMWRMIKLGAPIGVQFQLEVGAFTVIALLMGWLGTREIASHQIAINLASLTFMVPLGVSSAAAVRVGQAVGRSDAESARRSARVALVCGAAFMGMSGIVFIAIPGALARLYTSQMEVAALAAILIPIAGVFQVFDGLQVVAVGILRGQGETRTPMLVNILGFWLLGMPLSVYLGFGRNGGAPGLWWGLVVGLGAVAAFLLARVRVLMRREMRRVVIEDEVCDGVRPE
jgi:MATE family multidrug resistance protein